MAYGDACGCSTEASLSHELVRQLACKRTLLVLDDVRDARAVRACNPLGPHLLCTTFEGSIAKRLQTAVSSVGVRAYEMRVLSLPNMRSLLNAHFSFQVPPTPWKSHTAAHSRRQHRLSPLYSTSAMHAQPGRG